MASPRGAAPGALDARGVLALARQVASPNADERPAGEAITLVVVHGISLPPGRFGGDDIVALFTNVLDPGAHPCYENLRGLRVSAHFLIRRAGELVQFVPCAARAWHAGASRWRGRARCNDYSIGIEMEGADRVPYALAQYRRLAQVCSLLIARYPIADIVGHCDIAPGRKTDPGPAFEWPRLRALLASPRD